MTREEAIRKVESCLTDYFPMEDYGKVEKIIKALEKKPCIDVVSRQAVLNTLDFAYKALDEDRTVETYKELLIACYKDLPSVKHTQKLGQIYERYSGKYNSDMFDLKYCLNCEKVIDAFLDENECDEYSDDDIYDWLAEKFCYDCKHGDYDALDDCTVNKFCCPIILAEIKNEMQRNVYY